MSSGVAVRTLERLDERAIRGLAAVLVDCVAGGASVSFMHPLAESKAQSFWMEVARGVERGERALIVAEDESGEIAGTVQLILAQPENQPHRADLAKMLVHRRARRRGLGQALLAAAESLALARGKSLLVLDTVSGGDAARMYARAGWQRCGEIPGYALMPDGRPCPTTVYFKTLAPRVGASA